MASVQFPVILFAQLNKNKRFHTTKEKVFTKACALPTYYWLIASARAASCYGKSMAMAACMNKV